MKLEIEFNTMEELATKALELSDALIRQVKVPDKNVFETIKENKGDSIPVAPIAPESEPVQTQAVPTAPVPTTPVQETPTVPVQPAPQPVVAPVATTEHTFTVDELAKAGTDLMAAKPDVTVQLQQLLANFGVLGIPELPAERYGEFATALRGLGANI
ncbi:MAG: hypothetical protein E7A81_00670 [Clostridiales bacterium]|nr:hypothetical protein [Clostridiales bacterium]MDU1041572.1 hypothetical protein [Clostridiales bacterium]